MPMTNEIIDTLRHEWIEKQQRRKMRRVYIVGGIVMAISAAINLFAIFAR